LLYMIKIMMISITYMFVALRSHVHMSDVTNMLFIIFWIKLVLNLPKILTYMNFKNNKSISTWFKFFFKRNFKYSNFYTFLHVLASCLLDPSRNIIYASHISWFIELSKNSDSISTRYWVILDDIGYF
jgi:hypothetical protein